MPVEGEQKSRSSDIGVSIVRTVSALLVGLIVGLAGTKIAGLNEASVTPVVTMLVAAAYHSAVRFLEEKWPKAGILLGWAAKPSYAKKAD